jgi:aspartate aminotransferase-like enzyme
MSLLPDADRILPGPGPSLTASRVMRAMAAPTISHLDPGKIWRVGLMGASSSPRLIVLLRGALESALAKQGRHANV